MSSQRTWKHYLENITLETFADFTDAKVLKRARKYLIKYEKFREVVI